jgi:Co/Zn/Cd efflux system component
MSDCCEGKACALEALRARQRGTLRVVLAINAVMFLVEFSAAFFSSSTALLSDSLDNLGDALTYAVSLYAVSRSARTKATVALFKGSLILGAGLFAIGQVVYRLISPALPLFATMGAISILALITNGACLALLWKHRSEDINMSSVWECSRNDIASNVSVFVAALGVWLAASGWPDLVVGFCLACLFLRSGARVVSGAIREMKMAARQRIGFVNAATIERRS